MCSFAIGKQVYCHFFSDLPNKRWGKSRFSPFCGLADKKKKLHLEPGKHITPQQILKHWFLTSFLTPVKNHWSIKIAVIAKFFVCLSHRQQRGPQTPFPCELSYLFSCSPWTSGEVKTMRNLLSWKHLESSHTFPHPWSRGPAKPPKPRIIHQDAIISFSFFQTGQNFSSW